MTYKEHDVAGVGGWLAFFIITLCINVVLFFLNACEAWNAWDDASASLDTAAAGYFAIVVIQNIAAALLWSYLAWRLYTQHDASTPSVVIAGMWGVVLIAPIVNCLLGMAMLGITGDEAGKILARNVRIPLVYATLWSAYLMRSQRVANTYAASDTDYDSIF